MARAGILLRRLAIHAVLVGLCLLVAYPFIWMVLGSFKTNSELLTIPPPLLPRTWRLDNYRALVDAFPFIGYFLNSLKIAVLSVVGQLFCCSLAAYAFARLQFPGRHTLFLVLLGTMMIPIHVLIIPQFVLFRQLDWINTHWPLIAPAFFGGAFGTFLLRQFFLSIPNDLADAAIIDGANPFQIFAYVYLPLSYPALATLALFIFMGSWNDLLGPVIYLSDYKAMTLTVGLSYLQNQYEVRWPLVLAGSVLSILPIAGLYLAAQRYFIEGVILSGLKG